MILGRRRDGRRPGEAAASSPKTTSRSSRRPRAGPPTSSSMPAPMRPSTPCATARRTSWPRPSSTCSRARSSASGLPSTTASTTTSSCRAPLTPDDLAAIEARMGESVKADHPFVRKELPFDEGTRDRRRGRARPSRSRSSTTSQRKAEAAGEPLPPVTTFYEHGPFRDLCRGPHVESTGQDRPVQAPRGRRRLLARRRDARVDAADLRHGLGDAGGARPVPVAARGGEEARPPPPRRRSSTCSASTTSRPVRRSGTRRAGASDRPCETRCASSRSGVATRRSTRRRSCTRSCGSSPATGRSTATTCSCVDVEGQWFSLKPMNCPESTFIYRSRLRSYRDLPLRLSRVRRAAPQRAARASLSGLTRVRHFVTGRCPHLRPARPDRRRDRGADGRDPRGVRLVRPRRRRFDVRHAARQGAGRPGGVGARPRRSCATALDRSGLQYGSSRRTARSTRPRSTSTSTTRWAASGRRRRSRSTSRCCPIGSTSTTSTSTASSSGPSRSTARSTVRSSGSSASSSSTSRARSRCGVAPVQVVVIPIADRHVEAAEALAVELRGGGRPVRRGRRVRQPDAEQDPARAGPEGARTC